MPGKGQNCLIVKSNQTLAEQSVITIKEETK